MLRALAVVALAATAAAVSAAAAPDAARTLRYRVAGAPWNLGASSACPDGSTRYDIVTTAGRRIGTATICILASTKTDLADGGVVVTQRVLETDAFAAGWLRTRATQVYRNTADGRTARISVRGTAAGGTGRYQGARGTVTGAGTRHGRTIDVAVTVRLR